LSLFDYLFYRRKRRKLLTKMFKKPKEYSTRSGIRKWILQHRKTSIAILIVLITAKIAVAIKIYNDFNNLKRAVNAAHADIDTCLQMRENLIPQLADSMSDYFKHENRVFFHSADARADSIKRGPLSGKEPGLKTAGAESLKALGSKLFAVAEQYPELKTSESFQILMTKAADVEKEILEKRINYNAKAFILNRKVTSFPEMLYAFVYGVRPVMYFEWNNEAEWVPRRVVE